MYARSRRSDVPRTKSHDIGDVAPLPCHLFECSACMRQHRGTTLVDWGHRQLCSSGVSIVNSMEGSCPGKPIEKPLV